jgi:hypothetical protein
MQFETQMHMNLGPPVIDSWVFFNLALFTWIAGRRLNSCLGCVRHPVQWCTPVTWFCELEQSLNLASKGKRTEAVFWVLLKVAAFSVYYLFLYSENNQGETVVFSLRHAWSHVHMLLKLRPSQGRAELFSQHPPTRAAHHRLGLTRMQ